VEYDDFQDAVGDLAARGTRITKGGVALRLKIEPAAAGEMLDRMAREGRLELDLDETSGEIFYTKGRGTPAAEADAPASGGEAKSALSTLGKALDGDPLAKAKIGLGAALAMGKAGAETAGLAAGQRRKLAVGFLLGGLLPGFGLFYTAPLPVAVLASAAFVVGVKLIGVIPVLSTFLLIPFVVVFAVASAVLGGLYTWQYNQTGKRTPLGDEPGSAKQLLKRLRKG
jgi:hypothetical protein